jgi:predicted metalloprotease with PDZ domain
LHRASEAPKQPTATPIFFLVAIGIFLSVATPRGTAQSQREQKSVEPRAAATSDPHSLEPIVYTITVPAPNTHCAEVAMTVPTGRHDTVVLMMALWSPGFYRVEDYASRVEALSARTTDGMVLNVEQPKRNRWQIESSGAASVIVNYRIRCEERSVTTNWVGEDMGVFNGAATFLTLVESEHRPHEVRLELPSDWKRAVTSLDAAPDGIANHFRARDFDTLVDSPIVAGDITVTEFEVAGSKHIIADVGEVGGWESRRAAQDLEKLVRETHRFWGFLPFERYVFLNVFRRGGGGLEHKNSTLLTSSSARSTTPSLSWLSFVSHEYFHAFNVKRLRPSELERLDYENPPHTSSLWISEGLTTYFGELIVARARLASADDYLSQLSSHIRQLQNSPGRLVQTLEQSSLDVWSSGTSGVGRDNTKTVSYYVKGPVIGLLLDARIRRVTGGKKSLDDVIRLAYERYSEERGFTPDDFRRTAEEVAGVDLSDWFHTALASTEELDYAELLDWFGLQFSRSADPETAKTWKLEQDPNASEEQLNHLHHWLQADHPAQ